MNLFVCRSISLTRRKENDSNLHNDSSICLEQNHLVESWKFNNSVLLSVIKNTTFVRSWSTQFYKRHRIETFESMHYCRPSACVKALKQSVISRFAAFDFVVRIFTRSYSRSLNSADLDNDRRYRRRLFRPTKGRAMRSVKRSEELRNRGKLENESFNLPEFRCNQKSNHVDLEPKRRRFLSADLWIFLLENKRKIWIRKTSNFSFGQPVK